MLGGGGTGITGGGGGRGGGRGGCWLNDTSWCCCGRTTIRLVRVGKLTFTTPNPGNPVNPVDNIDGWMEGNAPIG